MSASRGSSRQGSQNQSISVRHRGGQVFGAVHRKINIPGKQGLIKFPGKEVRRTFSQIDGTVRWSPTDVMGKISK